MNVNKINLNQLSSQQVKHDFEKEVNLRTCSLGPRRLK